MADARAPAQLSSMESEPSNDHAEAYLAQVVRQCGAPAEVRASALGGRGVFTTRSLQGKDIIWKERPLVSMQHVSNREDAIACAHCHRFVGSVELQISHLLSSVARRGGLLTPSSGQQHDDGSHAPASSHEAGPSTTTGCQNGTDAGGNSTDSDLDDEEREEVDLRTRLACFANAQAALCAAPQLTSNVTLEEVSQLASGAMRLPLSDQVPLPAQVACRSGCGEVLCSQECEAQYWSSHHCLLCPGAPLPGSHRWTPPAAPPPPPSPAGAASAVHQQHQHQHQQQGPGASSASLSTAAAGAGQAGGSSSGQPQQQAGSEEALVHGLQVRRSKLPDFYSHACETNDIFLLAAQVVAKTAVAAAVGSGSRQAGSNQMPEAAEPPSRVPTTAPLPHSTSPASAQQGEGDALSQAWLPYGVGWKRVWWESVAVPEDVEDEQEFRAQLRSLAEDSLALLAAALPGVASAYPGLVSLDTWGSIIGMFELNNLALAVPSPVEDYFLLVDGLPETERGRVQAVTGRWLDALDKWYDTCCEGTGFFALQSCVNHSCEPNTATEALSTGEVALIALHPIKAGEEITISYLEEGGEDEESEEGGSAAVWSLKKRQAALRDYGFTCTCPRCTRELEQQRQRRSAALSRRGGGGGGKGGVKVARR